MRPARAIFALAAILVITTLSSAAAEVVDVWSRPARRAPIRTYDVRHYRIALRVDDETRSFRGETTVTLSPLEDGMRTVHLDTETFTVTAVRDAKGKGLRFGQENGGLDVALEHSPARGETMDMTIAYEARNVRVDPTRYGMSADYPLGLGFRDETPDNPRLVSTLSFPTGARHWFPCFDHPSDKATSEVLVTVRKDWSVLSNGRLNGIADDPAGKTRTFHWRQEQPHSTYLFVLVAGPYAVLTDAHGAVPLGYWVYPKDVADAPRTFARTPEILRFFERTFGVPYPCVKYDPRWFLEGPRGGGGCPVRPAAAGRRRASAGVRDGRQQFESAGRRAQGLATWQSAAMAPFLAERFRMDRSYLARAEAIRGLGHSRDRSFLPLIAEAARMPSPRGVVRSAAVAARDQLEK